MKKIYLLLLVLLNYNLAIGQLKSTPSIYLQTDRDMYLSGDTLWAKGYLTGNTDIQPSSLTIELQDIKEKKIILSQTFLISGNTAGITIVLPPTLPTGLYLIHVYSRELTPQRGTGFAKRIKIYNLFDTEREELIFNETLLFFPEGGHLIAGDTNKIAFSFTDKTGKPSNTAGKIINDAGTEVCTFKSTHNGMGVFYLKPKHGDHYFAIKNDDPKNTKYPLPDPVNNGVLLSTKSDDNQISFSIKSNFKDSLYYPAFLTVQMGKIKIYETALQKTNTLIKGAIPLLSLPSGVVRLSIFDRDTLLLAERLCFINNKEYELPATLSISLLSKEAGAENLFSLDLGGKGQGSYAVSVIDASFEETDTDVQNIYSASLLTPYLEKKVYNAGKYFDGGYGPPGTLLDMVMLTNFWKGKKWEEKNINKAEIVKPGIEILTGKIFYKDSRTPYANGTALLVTTSETDSATRTFTLLTDSNGVFEANIGTLFGRHRLVFSAVGKKNIFIDVQLYHSSEIIIPTEFSDIVEIKKLVAKDNGTKYDSLMHANGYIENVVIKSGRNARTQALEKRYTTGRFKTLYGEVYDLTNVKTTSGNILDYLATAGYPDIKVAIDKAGVYKVQTRKLNGAISATAIFLDETMVLAQEQLYLVKPNDVAIIKVVQNMEFNNSGPIPTLAIYTRKGRDFDASNKTYDIEYYDGISKPFKFNNTVSPPSVSDLRRDNRTTLYWNSKAATSKRVNFIPIHFYNNEITKIFKIVVEGISTNGQLLHFEKKL